MIEYRKGNLLDVTSGLIAHGCNTQGVMGAGVALAVKKKYPSVFASYENICNEAREKQVDILGDVQTVHVSDSNLIIANCFTQKYPSKRLGERMIDYEAVASCFERLEDISKFLKLTEINIPRIGAGLGRGNWKIISTIIEETCKTPVIVWDL